MLNPLVSRLVSAYYNSGIKYKIGRHVSRRLWFWWTNPRLSIPHPASSMQKFLKGYSLKVSEEINRKVFFHIFLNLMQPFFGRAAFRDQVSPYYYFLAQPFLTRVARNLNGRGWGENCSSEATARARLQNSHSAVKCHLEVSVSITTQSSSLWAAAVPVNTRWSKTFQLTLEELFLKRIIMGQL